MFQNSNGFYWLQINYLIVEVGGFSCSGENEMYEVSERNSMKIINIKLRHTVTVSFSWRITGTGDEINIESLRLTIIGVYEMDVSSFAVVNICA